MSFKDYTHHVKAHAKRDFNAIGASFSDAYAKGNHAELAIKAGGVAVGALLGAKGVSQFVQGAGERVPSGKDDGSEQMNYMRMFVGAFSAFAGAAALYLAATKGVLPARGA